MSEFDLGAMTAEYVKKLPRKLEEIAAAVAAARATPGDAAALEPATRLAHRLRGTAGSYGLPAIGNAAGRLEDALGRVTAAAGAAGWDEVTEAFAELGRIAAAAAPPP